MVLITFAILFLVYGAVASWAYRSGGARRLWLVGVCSTALVLILTTVVSIERVPNPRSAAIYLGWIYGLPVLVATGAGVLARGRFAGVLLGGVLGFIAALAGALYALA